MGTKAISLIPFYMSLFIQYTNPLKEESVDDIEVYKKYWEEMSISKREALLGRALHQFGKPWEGRTITEMAKNCEIGSLPAFFSLAFIAPLMIDQSLS